MAYITLIKGFIGSGILYLPNSYYNGGWGFSSIALVLCAILSMYCVTLLLQTKKKIGVNSYSDIGIKTYGPCGRHAVSIVLIAS